MRRAGDVLIRYRNILCHLLAVSAAALLLAVSGATAREGNAAVQGKPANQEATAEEGDAVKTDEPAPDRPMTEAEKKAAAEQKLLKATLAQNEKTKKEPPPKDFHYIRNVTVLTMSPRGAVRRAAVVVHKDRILAVEQEHIIASHEGIPTVDGKGGYLIPGLIDSHVHLDHPSVLAVFPSCGVTTVLNMRGTPETLRLRERVKRGARFGPTIYTAGDIIESAPGSWAGFTLVETEEQAREVVRRQVEAGYDFIKVYHHMTPAHFLAVMDEARKVDRAVLGHAPRGMPVKDVAGAGFADFAHGMELVRHNEAEDGKLRLRRRTMSRLRRNGVAVTPNLVYLSTLAEQQNAPDTVRRLPEANMLHPVLWQWFDPANNPYATQGASAATWNSRRHAAVRTLTKRLHDKDVALLAGSDALAAGIYPCSSLQDELAELVAAGLSPYEALQAATTVPSRFIRERIDASFDGGTITQGARADLILLAQDPRRDIANVRDIRGVMLHGKWWSAEDLDRRMTIEAVNNAVEREAVRSIEAHIRAGRIMQARAVYDEARAARPRAILFHRFAFLGLAEPYLLAGDKVVTDRARLEKAVTLFRMYTDTYPGLHFGYVRLAQALTALGRCGEAGAALDRVRALRPEYPLSAVGMTSCAPPVVSPGQAPGPDRQDAPRKPEDGVDANVPS